MFPNLAQLVRYRGLIQSLVARELKARYRGSVLGFLWSFINPLLLLSIYTFVFSVIQPNRNEIAQPFAIFLFCGILPWNWFSSSLMEASNSLVSGGNLIKKVLFPAEVLPIVSVLANMVHFFLGLVILVVFLIVYQHPPDAWDRDLGLDIQSADTEHDAGDGLQQRFAAGVDHAEHGVRSN